MREKGYTDLEWLHAQALDDETRKSIETIVNDERYYLEEGIISNDETELVLRMKQGTFYATRRTGHSMVNVFVQIYKTREHAQRIDFLTNDMKTLIDIGANEGYYAIMMLSSNPRLHVIALEPNPIAFRLLEKNIRANGFSDRVTLINKAVWSKSGRATMHIIPQVTSIGTLRVLDSSFMKEAVGRVEEVVVDAVTIEEVLRDASLDCVDLIKIDVEGGEVDVLSSFKDLRVADRFVLEYHNSEIKEWMTSRFLDSGFEEVLHAPDRKDFGDVYFVKSNEKTLSSCKNRQNV